ncbi:phosphomannomutase [Bacillus sp. ISL-75]|nr:phosphomannomutase [Bacillus sp. ISL-75]
MPENCVIIKTIVTSEIGRAIAEHYGIKSIDTLTGFKFVGEKINEFDQTGASTLLFGNEESYGYLIGDFVRDKDAVQSAILAAEVAAFYKSKGMTMYEGLLAIFERYGFYLESFQSITLKGKDGAEQIAGLMDAFRSERLMEVAGIEVAAIEYYSTSLRFINGTESKIDLPQSNVLKYHLADGSWFCLRPSGTEPKAKFYFGVKGETMEDSQEKLSAILNSVMNRFDAILS